jgi:transposase-like protein
MGRKRVEGSEPCPHCGATSVRRNGTNRGRQRWWCRDCGRTFGETFGTPLYGLHTPVAEIVQALMILMRRGSLRAAEEITGHKYETIGDWLLRAHAHAEAITEVLVKDLELDEVEADAFWSFIGNASRALQTGQVRHRGWAWPKKTVHAGGA